MTMLTASELLSAARAPAPPKVKREMTTARVDGYERRVQRRRELATRARDLEAQGQTRAQIAAALERTPSYIERLIAGR